MVLAGGRQFLTAIIPPSDHPHDTSMQGSLLHICPENLFPAYYCPYSTFIVNFLVAMCLATVTISYATHMC